MPCRKVGWWGITKIGLRVSESPADQGSGESYQGALGHCWDTIREAKMKFAPKSYD